MLFTYFLVDSLLEMNALVPSVHASSPRNTFSFQNPESTDACRRNQFLNLCRSSTPVLIDTSSNQ
jgi:hypothetical protein